MTEPDSTFPCTAAGAGVPPLASSSGETWFRSRDGRRYGRELGLVIVVKLSLLIVLWLVFIQPWPRPATPAASVVQQFYVPSPPAAGHD
jgi:hypothetical protein